jgi:membrane-bound ClpP family serine protease
MHEAGPPIALAAIGLILWLAVTSTVAGFSIQTIGLILFISGAVWLVIELTMPRVLARQRRVIQD